MPEAKITNTLIEKTILVLKPYKLTWKNGTAPSYKMPEAKKTNTLIEKTILVLKTLSFHMKKRHNTVLQNAWSQKNKHSHWKNNSGLKTLKKNHMKKRHSTVLQNAWGQKNKHSHWKNISGLKNIIISHEKTAQRRLTKCLKPKIQTLSLKKQLRLQKP